MQTVDFDALAEAVSKVGLTPEILRETRMRSGYSYRKWGPMIGCSAQYACNLETGMRRVTPEFQRRFMAVMEAMSLHPEEIGTEVLTQAVDPAVE